MCLWESMYHSVFHYNVSNIFKSLKLLKRLIMNEVINLFLIFISNSMNKQCCYPEMYFTLWGVWSFNCIYSSPNLINQCCVPISLLKYLNFSFAFTLVKNTHNSWQIWTIWRTILMIINFWKNNFIFATLLNL